MMCKRLVCLICLVLVLSLGADVRAATVTWIGDGPDQLWSTPAHWDSGAVPTILDVVIIKTSHGPIVANEGAITKNIRVGASGGDDATLTVNGGTLELSVWSAAGAWPVTATGTVNLKSGAIDCKNEFVVGNQGTGILNMTGGTFAITFNLIVGREPGSIGHVDLFGGILTANNLKMRDEAGSVGSIDVRAGTLILDGNKLSTVQGFIDNGWITAYDGDGTLQLDYDVTNEGQTTLTATHLLDWAIPDRPCICSIVLHYRFGCSLRPVSARHSTRKTIPCTFVWITATTT